MNQEVTHANGQGTVIRLTEGGVGYRKPPLSKVWDAIPGKNQHYQMNWERPPSLAQTLGDLARNLRQQAAQRPYTDRRHHDLQDLDQAVASLLQVVADLHARHWQVGLLNPENIVLANQQGELKAVLVDLGFWFDATKKVAPPAWLTANPFAPLWGNDDPQQRQQAWAESDPAFPQSDLQLLARLLAYLLTGQMPPSPDALPTGHRAAPVWHTLWRALRGELTSVQELSQELQVTPPSEHFLKKSASAIGFVVGGAVVVLLAVVGVGAAIYWGGKNGTQPQDQSPQLAGKAGATDKQTERPTREQDKGPDNDKDKALDEDKDKGPDNDKDGPEPTRPLPPEWEKVQQKLVEAKPEEIPELLIRYEEMFEEKPPPVVADQVVKPTWDKFRRHWVELVHQLERDIDPTKPDPDWEIRRFQFADQASRLNEQMRKMQGVLKGSTTLNEEEERCFRYIDLVAKEYGLGG
jgi:hypothetical protein